MKKPNPKITVLALTLAILLICGLYETFKNDEVQTTDIENQDDDSKQYGDLDFYIKYEYRLTEVANFQELDALKQHLITDRNSKFINILLKSEDMEHNMDAFKAADKVLEILKMQKTICPIYLDIDDIIANENVEYPASVINYFVSRLQENRCLVGLTGSKENLDSYLEKGIFTNVFYLPKEDISENNTYQTLINFNKIIQTNNMNNPSNFLDNPVEEVMDGDSLWTIMRRYYEIGNYTDDIARYNNIPDPDRIWPGMKVTIPVLNRSKLETNIEPIEYTAVSNRYSIYSEKEFDIYTICDFINNYRTKPSFNATKILENGGKVGGNIIINSLTIENAQSEANHALEVINEWGINYVICIDITPVKLQELLKLSPAEINDILNVWYQTLHAAGYSNILVKSSDYGIMMLSSLGILDDKEVAIVSNTSLDYPSLLYTGDNVGIIYDIPSAYSVYNVEPNNIFAIRDYTVPNKDNQSLTYDITN